MLDMNNCFGFYFTRNGRCVEKLFPSLQRLLAYIEKYHKTVCDFRHRMSLQNYEEYVVFAEDVEAKCKCRYGVIYTPKGVFL